MIDIYGRLSYLSDGTAVNVDEQLKMGAEDIEGRGAVVGESFRDDARSAWNPKVVRPQWEQLMARLEAGVFDGVWVLDVTRFSHRTEDRAQLAEHLRVDHRRGRARPLRPVGVRLLGVRLGGAQVGGVRGFVGERGPRRELLVAGQGLGHRRRAGRDDPGPRREPDEAAVRGVPGDPGPVRGRVDRDQPVTDEVPVTLVLNRDVLDGSGDRAGRLEFDDALPVQAQLHEDLLGLGGELGSRPEVGSLDVELHRVGDQFDLARLHAGTRSP